MNTTSKETIERSVASDKLIHWKITLAFLSTAHSGVLELNGKQLTKDAWLLRSSPIFNVRKLTKNSARVLDFFGLKYLTHLENVGEKKALRI